MLKNIIRILLSIIVFQISLITLSADSDIEDIIKSVNKIDSISIENITETDDSERLDKNLTISEKFKRTFKRLGLNYPGLLAGNFFQIVLGIFLIALINFFIIAYFNTRERFFLKRNLERELASMNNIIAEKTKKLTVVNRNLTYEIEQLKNTKADFNNLKNAIEKMRLGVTMTDLDGKIIYTNKANADIHGYTQIELIGEDISKLTIDLVRTKFTKKNIQKWMGKVIRISDKRKDGSLFIAEISTDMVYDDDGAPAAIIICCKDLTEKENSGKTLINNEENYKRLFENIQDIYFEVDIDGKIIEINPSIEDISDLTRDELIGKPIVDLYYNKEQGNSLLKALRKDEHVNDFEIVIKGKKGMPVTCFLTAKLMLDKSDLPIEIIGSMRNITMQKEVEKQRNLILEDLTLTNKELRNFVYITSHELKSPLKAINKLANWISKDYEDKFDEDGKQHMKLLIGKTVRMHQLIEGLSLYYNITGNEQLNNVNITELLNNLILSMNLHPKITITLGAELPNVIYNKNRLSQIFSNLIENSIKFSNKPKTQIVIDCHEDEKEWVFSLADNGHGIEEKYFENIFQIFKSLNNHDETETAGVGLAIVKKIIEMNNGKIWVESKLNSGCKFFFTIPRKRGKQIAIKNN
ncbi:MAG: PAS domain S-box protein [Candidatus Cloacimonetes bacterium]|nr:PAS domain S-box protein [Candidatus Cloacimonadota bacterium]